jgi:hypothetical protein
MKIRRGLDGCRYAVFRDEDSAERWAWLFWGIFRKHQTCFNGYYNAYKLS